MYVRRARAFMPSSGDRRGMASKREWKALAGIAAVLFGAGFSGMYVEHTTATVAFGLIALAGGIVIMDQVMDAEQGATA